MACPWLGFPGGPSGKEPACPCRDMRDAGLIPGSGRSRGGGHAIHSSTLAWRILMDRGAWQATALRVAQSRTWLKRLNTHTHTHTCPWLVLGWTEEEGPASRSPQGSSARKQLSLFTWRSKRPRIVRSHCQPKKKKKKSPVYAIN